MALLSGTVTSGRGCALWDAGVPRPGAGRAAVAQPSVPLIAAPGGFALPGELPGPAFRLAAAMVPGGIGFSLLPAARR